MTGAIGNACSVSGKLVLTHRAALMHLELLPCAWHGIVQASRSIANAQSGLYTNLQVSHPLWSAAKALLTQDAC